jgi:hypothetical protein
MDTINYSLAAKANKRVGVVEGQILTPVPAGAVFTDTVYAKPASEPISYITSLQTTLDGKVDESREGVVNGVATLDGAGLVPTGQLPSFVDDVLEFANLAGFPATGATGKIYVAIDTNKTYRWSGTVYVYITSGAVDSVVGKTGIVTLVKGDVGLGNVDNTTDVAKPVSTAQQTALNLKANQSTTYTKTEVDDKAALKADKLNFTSTGIDDNATSTAITVNTNNQVTVGTMSQTAAFTGESVSASRLRIGTSATAGDEEGQGLLQIQGYTPGVGSACGTIEFLDKRENNSIVKVVAERGDGGIGSGELHIKTNNGSDVFSINATFPSTGGITFNGDTAAANALDDYEEGVWTPTITFAGANAGMTFGTQTGQYTKVGDVVTASCRVVLSAKGTSTGVARLVGLPFLVANLTSAEVSRLSVVTFADAPTLFGEVGTNGMQFGDTTNAGVYGNLDDTNFANTSSFIASISYQV